MARKLVGRNSSLLCEALNWKGIGMVNTDKQIYAIIYVKHCMTA